MITDRIKLLHSDTHLLILKGIYICSIILGIYALGFHQERVIVDL